jgi:mono/diheme cytochrome c family protein
MCFLALLFALPNAVAQETPRGDGANGKALYASMGCGSCHGYEGQGSRDGPKLNPPPAFEVTLLQLRQPRDLMPPYREAILSDKQAADLFTYMTSFPKPPDVKAIRLLQEN